MKKELAYFIEIAMPAVNALPLPQRADAYYGIASAWAVHDQKLSEQAAAAARLMQQAEASQLTFAALMQNTLTKEAGE
jgi:hypothetical protein